MGRMKAPLSPILLTTSLQTLYTVPKGTKVKDISFDFFNADTANAIGVTMHFIPAGGSATATNQVLSELTPGGFVLFPNESRPYPSDQALDADGFIQAKASITNKVSVHTTVNEYV